MNEIAFTTEKFFSVNGGLAHLKHALRDKFDPERIPEPKIEIQKFQNGSLNPVTKEEIYQAYEYNLERKQRKNANLFFEEMVSDYPPETTPYIAEYLSLQFEGRPVYVVSHYDEGHFHTHFLVFYKDAEHSKAPRINIKNLWEIRKDIPALTGQKRIMPGAGKQRHVGLQRDKEMQEKLLQQERERAKQIEEILAQIEKVVKLYGSGGIRIYSLNREKGIRFAVRNVEKQEVFTDIHQIPIKKLVQISEKEGEELYFQPVEGQQRGIFLDDFPVSEADLLELPRGSLVVQTSPGKLQVHIPLPKPEPIEKAALLQKAFVNFYNADAGSKDILHLRRLPGFPNKKYPERPIVKVLGYAGTKTWDEVITAINRQQEEIEQEQAKRWEHLQKTTPKRAPDIALELEYGNKIWQDRLAKAEGDESRADISYAMHLLRKGFSDEEVQYILAEVSENLQFRKKGHVDDYLQRTVEKAKYFLQLGQEPTKDIQKGI